MLCVVSDEAELNRREVRDDSSVCISNDESDEFTGVIKQRRDRYVCVVGSAESDCSSGVLVVAMHRRCAQLREHLHGSVYVGVGGSGVCELGGSVDNRGRVRLRGLDTDGDRVVGGTDGTRFEYKQSRE